MTVAAIAIRLPRLPRRLVQRMTSPPTTSRTQPAPALGQSSTAGDEDERGDADKPEPDERPRPVAAFGENLGRDRGVLALVRDDEHGCEVDEEPCAAEQRQDDEPEPEDCGVDVEVAAETAGDAGDDTAGGAALEALHLRGMCEWLCHEMSVPTNGPR